MYRELPALRTTAATANAPGSDAKRVAPVESAARVETRSPNARVDDPESELESPRLGIGGSPPASLLLAVRIRLPAERVCRLAGAAVAARPKDLTHTTAAETTSVTAPPERDAAGS